MVKRNGDLTTRELETLLVAAETKLQRTHDVLGTLIAWMSHSSVSPIRIDEARQLLAWLNQE